MRALLIGVVVSGALLLGACSSGPAATTSTTTTAAVVTSPPTTTSTTAASTTTTTAAAPTTTTPPASTSVPAVAHGTSLSVEPVISAGSSPAPTTLETKDLIVGTGTTALKTSTVTVKYVGADYANGTDFTQSTWTSGQPTSFPLTGGVIKGFQLGIAGMKIGGRREIVIPPSLGYGTQTKGTITPGETLVFIVDLVAVKA